MNTSIFDLIRFIVWRATEARKGLSTLALVKYLYLADLYYAEETGGKTLTGLPWIFYHYGPYCTESFTVIEDAVKRDFISARNYDSKGTSWGHPFKGGCQGQNAGLMTRNGTFLVELFSYLHHLPVPQFHFVLRFSFSLHQSPIRI